MPRIHVPSCFHDIRRAFGLVSMEAEMEVMQFVNTQIGRIISKRETCRVMRG